MYNTDLHSVSYDWGGITTFTPDLRSHELAQRAKWFINMRWTAAVACFLGAAAAHFSFLPARINPIYFAAVAVFLAVSNGIYALVGRNLFGDKSKHRALTILLVSQMLTDFFSLSVLTYACGSIETPISTLFMAHIILATMFFRNRVGIAIMGAAWFFASLPLCLEWLGVLPAISIFDDRSKLNVLNDVRIVFGFVLGTGAVYFVCRYLVSVITASLKLRELQLEEAYRTMVQMDREKTQATLRATHELKAPFAAIKSYVYTLKDGYCGPLPEKAAEVVSKIGDRCDNLMKKIVDIIHLSNIRTLVVSDLNLVPVDIAAVLNEEIQEGSLIAVSRKIKLVNLIDTDQSTKIVGSQSHLKTLFSNLIQNAISYSNAEIGKVEVSMRAVDQRVAVTVKDNGIGIPVDNISKIFDEHFRTKEAVAHNPSGTGLGLSIVKEIVRLHSATIDVESTVGKGTSFTVSFEQKDSKQEREDHGEHTDN